MCPSRFRKLAIARKQLGFEVVEPRRLLAGIEIAETVDRTIVNDNRFGFDSYMISLDTQPTSDVVVDITTSNPLVQFGVQFGGPEAVFTPDDWSPKRVIVWSDGDQTPTGNLNVTLSHTVTTIDPAYQSATVRNVNVQLIDTDSQIWLINYDYELMEGQSNIIFPNAMLPSGYAGPNISFSYDTTQIFIDNIGSSTSKITAINDGIEEGIHDVPISYVADGQLPPGVSPPPIAVVRISDPVVPQYAGFQINDGQGQRSIVDHIRLYFSDNIFVSPGAISLTNSETGAVSPVFAIVGNDQKSLDIFPGQNYIADRSLADGNYELIVPSWSITHVQSGLAIPQDIRLTSADGLFRLFGDLNGNATIDQSELDAFNAAYPSSLGESNYVSALDDAPVGFVGEEELSSIRKIKIDSNVVSEDATVGTVVGNLSAFSLLGPIVDFQVVSVDGLSSNLPFVAQNGSLVVSSGLDYEANRLHEVVLRGLTQQGIATYGQIDIKVTNVNENSSAPIGLTNDQVLENAPGLVGDLFVLDSNDSWQFSLVEGPGGYDNSLFEINGNQLIVLDSPDYESRDDYSIRVVAESPSGQVVASLTIQITPVDEFAPQGFVFSTEQFGDWYSIPYLVENSPVGQPATRIRVLDEDRGEVYTFSGYFADLAIIEGDAFVPIRPINFEEYVWPYGFLNSVTATSSNGVVFSRSGDTASILDINDAPIVSEAPPNQSVNAGTVSSFQLPSTTFFDEDTWDSLSLTASLTDGPLPAWLTFDGSSGLFFASPSVIEAGSSLQIEVTATDLSGVSATTSFQLNLIPRPRLTVLGTGGNDRIQVNRLSGAANSWRVIRNGQNIFSGNLDNYVVAIEGLGGNDRVTFGGSNVGNSFELYDSFSSFDLATVVLNNVEQLEVLGGQGNDLLKMFATNPSGVNSVTFNGNNGSDTLQSILIDNSNPIQWNIDGPNRGNVSNSLQFQSVEQLLGSYGADQFNLLSNSASVEQIDGGGGADGLNAIRGVQLTVDSLGPFFGTLDGIRVANLIRIELGNTNATVIGPESSAQSQVFWSAGSQTNYVQLTGSQTIDLFGFSNLIGRSADDQFVIWDGSTSRIIDGGSGFDLLILTQQDAGVDLRTMSAAGVARFSRIDAVQGTGTTSTIFGPNADVQWTYDNYAVKSRWAGTPEIMFINFGTVVAGNRQDVFSVSTFVAPDFGSYPAIRGGGGSDTISTFYNPSGVYDTANLELLSSGRGTVMGISFDGIENLIAGAITDSFNFHDLLSNDVWFSSIRVTDANVFSFIRYLGQQGVTVNFQNRSASGVGLFEGLDYFSGTDSDDTVIGANRDSNWFVRTDTGGMWDGLLDSVIGFENLRAGSGSDLIYVSGSAADVSVVKSVQGGAGIDTLSFSGRDAAVNASLASGYASIFVNGIGQFENLIGTRFDDYLEGNNFDNVLVGLDGNDQIFGLNGNDVILGGSGNDRLYGGAGRDLLLGGTGSDWLYGGSGDDLIISGISNQFAQESYDEATIDFAAFRSIMAEWTSNRTYSQRISRLRSGVGPGSSVALNSSTIQSDGEIDQVFGEADSDWFWLGIEDLAPDRLSGERLN